VTPTEILYTCTGFNAPNGPVTDEDVNENSAVSEVAAPNGPAGKSVPIEHAFGCSTWELPINPFPRGMGLAGVGVLLLNSTISEA
jgi:hypothetical protein